MNFLPTTVTALLIVVLVGLPGFFGDLVFASFVGRDLRAKQWEVLLRWLSFSVLGLFVYTILAEALGWQPPVHVIPRQLSALANSPDQLPALAFTFLGHSLAALGVGGVSVSGKKALTRLSPVSFYQNVWDEFARSFVQGRWVVVSLKSGEVYAGILARGQLSVSREQRDIVLEEPAECNGNMGTYMALPYQYLYLSGACSLPNDERKTEIWKPIFLDEENDGEQ